MLMKTEIIIVRGQSRLTDGIFSNSSKQKQLWFGYQVSNKLQVAVRSSRRSLNAKLSVKVIYRHEMFKTSFYNPYVIPVSKFSCIFILVRV